MANATYEDKIVVTNTHDAGYRLTTETCGNGLTRTISYDRSDNLRSLDTVKKGNLIVRQEWHGVKLIFC